MKAFSDTQPPEQCQHRRSGFVIDCTGARVSVYARSLATVLRVDGEIDMANADLVAQAIRRYSQLKAPLILDLSHLDFLGIAGFQVLLALNDEHQVAELHYHVVTGDAVRRLTRVIAGDGLPIVESVLEALQRIEEVIRARRQFLYGMARQLEPQRHASSAGTDARDVPTN